MIQRVLNIEDAVLKHAAIKRALLRNGVSTVDWAKTAEEGLSLVVESLNNDHPYNLIITDMHFSVNGKENNEAGLYVIEELRKMKYDGPIVVCSTVRYRIDDVEACIFFNEKSGDIDSDIAKVLKNLK